MGRRPRTSVKRSGTGLYVLSREPIRMNKNIETVSIITLIKSYLGLRKRISPEELFNDINDNGTRNKRKLIESL